MAEDTATRAEAPAGPTGTMTEVYLGLLWLAITVWTAHVSLSGNTEGPSGLLGTASEALPGLVATTLLTTASIGQAAGSRFRTLGGKLLAGLGVGLFFGIVSVVGLRFAYGSAHAITILALIVAFAGVVGGGVAAILPDKVVEAGLWASTWVFFAGVILAVWQPNMMNALGGGPTADAAAQAVAQTRFADIAAVLTGLLGGVHASTSLRNERGRLWFLLAGALPGLVLLGAEALTRLGGSLLSSDLPAGDPALALLLGDPAVVRHGLIVLAVCAVVTVVFAGRSASSDD